MSDASAEKRPFGRLAVLAGIVLIVLALQALASGGGAALWDGARRWAYGKGLDLTKEAASISFTVGETSLTLPSGSSLETGGPLLDAALSADGLVCYLTEDSTYKTVFTIADESGTVQYRWYSASRYLTACALGDGVAAVAGLITSGAWELLLLEPGEEGPTLTLQLEDQTVYDMKFLDDTLCLISDTAIFFLQGDTLQTACTYTWPQGYAFGDGFAAVLLDEQVWIAGENGHAELLECPGAEALTASGDYLAVLADGEIIVYTAGGHEVSRTAWEGETFQLRRDGSLVQPAS